MHKCRTSHHNQAKLRIIFQNIMFEALVPTKHKLGLFVDMKAVSKANKTSYFIKPLKQYLVSPKFSSSTSTNLKA